MATGVGLRLSLARNSNGSETMAPEPRQRDRGLLLRIAGKPSGLSKCDEGLKKLRGLQVRFHTGSQQTSERHKRAGVAPDGAALQYRGSNSSPDRHHVRKPGRDVVGRKAFCWRRITGPDVAGRKAVRGWRVAAYVDTPFANVAHDTVWQ